MYLSNTRLISLLFALAGLTLGLLWLLSKQVAPAALAPTALNAEVLPQLAAGQTEANAPDKTVEAIPSLEPAPEPAETMTTPAAAAVLQASQAKKLEQPELAKPAAKPTEMAAVPENLVLSEKELKALSAKDRKRYEKMLESLSSVRDQSTQLTTERQRLEQQMQELEQRNLELTRQLEQVRQTTETTAANQPQP